MVGGRGIQKTRWADELDPLAGDWRSVALEEDTWLAAEDGFVVF